MWLSRSAIADSPCDPKPVFLKMTVFLMQRSAQLLRKSPPPKFHCLSEKVDERRNVLLVFAVPGFALQEFEEVPLDVFEAPLVLAWNRVVVSRKAIGRRRSRGSFEHLDGDGARPRSAIAVERALKRIFDDGVDSPSGLGSILPSESPRWTIPSIFSSLAM